MTVTEEAVAPVEDVEDVSAEEDYESGLEALRGAFTDPPAAPETPADEDDSEATGEEEPTGATAQGLTDEQLQYAFRDPRVVGALRSAQERQLAQARALWEQEQYNRRQQEEEAILDDEEIGRRFRAQKELEPVVRNAQAAGYARATQELIQQGIGDIWNVVPELKTLPEASRAALNPLDPRFTTMGAYFNAVIDTVAAQRAEKLAEKKAKEMAKAQVKDEVARLRKSQPNPAGAAGKGSATGPAVDVDRQTGREILRQAFGA